jgi:hypothetical protein
VHHVSPTLNGWLQLRARLYLLVLTTKATFCHMGKLSILGEFWDFLRIRKKVWLAPIVGVLLLLAILIVVTEGSALAPFIYALF